MFKQHSIVSYLVLSLAALAIRAEAATPKIFSTVMNSAQNRITVSGQGFSPAGLPMPSAGVLKNLTVVAYVAMAPATPPVPVQVQVLVNDTATSLTCSVTVTTVKQPTPCSDSTYTVSVKAGDLITITMTTPAPRLPDGDPRDSMTMTVSLEKE